MVAPRFRRTGRAATVTDSDRPASDPPGGPLDRFVRAFYDARREAARAGDPGRLEPFIADDVRWREPDVGAHMGDLRGRDAVLDMIRRALATTGGTFDLRVTATVETGSHVAALIAWSAERDGERIEGRELAVYEVRDGRIAAARFHPENIADDRVFWGEGRPRAGGAAGRLQRPLMRSKASSAMRRASVWPTIGRG